jgi:hypothetical protein
MAALLSFAAWIFNLFLGFVSAAMAGWFFLVSPTFRHQAYARWARQPQTKTLGEIGEGGETLRGVAYTETSPINPSRKT